MSSPKTVPHDGSVDGFVAGVANERRRRDTEAVLELTREVTGEPGTLWGPSIIGFGSYHYRYETGREGDAPRIGLSPRAGALTFYGLQDAPESESLLGRLGPHSLGASCLYVKDLAKVDRAVLAELLRLAWAVER